MDSANVARFVEAKDGSGLVQGDVLADANAVLVKSTSHEVEIGENKGFGRVESNRDNILRIALTVTLNFLDSSLLGE